MSTVCDVWPCRQEGKGKRARALLAMINHAIDAADWLEIPAVNNLITYIYLLYTDWAELSSFTILKVRRVGRVYSTPISAEVVKYTAFECNNTDCTVCLFVCLFAILCLQNIFRPRYCNNLYYRKTWPM